MADTRQIVSWSLERECPFRSGDGWYLPDKTWNQLADLRTVASAEGDRRNFEGICVTSWTTGEIPCDGFRIEDRLQKVGGLSAARRTCQACEANARNELGIPVAGCFGYVDVWPDSKELDEELWRIIEERNLEDRLRAAFPVTTPLWYGFWINSPLRRPQAEFLFELLDVACDHDDPQDKDIRHLLNALDAAIRWELPLHVSLAPLGHTDFGWYTIFPHCPRCKADALAQRWTGSYPETAQNCRACGQSFVPNDHHSEVQDDADWDRDSLKSLLGEAGFDRFVVEYLQHRGHSALHAESVLDENKNGPLLRRVKAVREQRDATLEQLRGKALSPSDTPSAELTVPLAESLAMEFSLIPAGEFLMGSNESEPNPTQLPRHAVQIARPFFLGRYPVTQAEWISVMGKNPSAHRGDARLPVEEVSWFDAQEFCDKLCQKFGRVFRLPTEAEWEYACRAGTTTAYAFGDSISPAEANFTPRSELFPSLSVASEASPGGPRRRANTAPVGSYPPNAWGLYDMHGNLAEWCEDVWHADYEGAPVDGSAWLEGEDQEPSRVTRGGWASGTEAVCTSSARQWLMADAGSPRGDEDDDEESELMSWLMEASILPCGFRVVCECL